MFSKALISLAALVSVQAVPLEPRQFDNYYIKPTVKLNGSPLNGAAINANNGSFYIGKPTTTFCPGEIYPCQTFSNVTAINIFQTSSAASMDAYVPGGQIVYVTVTGALGYTAAHAQNVPKDAKQKGFIRTEVLGPKESYAMVIFLGQTWWACPVEGEYGVYKIYAAAIEAKRPGTCAKFDMQAVEVGNQEPQAYQYVSPYTVS
ncbi:hypothetical protein BGZ60DRAFT_527455 [Tricladium varicosporioides]|nr:hypothetical protein BGZ60DRAFT_527455 [Hymenoscyphus varicosporioides]